MRRTLDLCLSSDSVHSEMVGCSFSTKKCSMEQLLATTTDTNEGPACARQFAVARCGGGGNSGVGDRNGPQSRSVGGARWPLHQVGRGRSVTSWRMAQYCLEPSFQGILRPISIVKNILLVKIELVFCDFSVYPIFTDRSIDASSRACR